MVLECMTAVRVSVKDELSLSVSVAVGSTLVSLSFCLGSFSINDLFPSKRHYL